MLKNIIIITKIINKYILYINKKKIIKRKLTINKK